MQRADIFAGFDGTLPGSKIDSDNLIPAAQGPNGNGVIDLYTPEISCVCADPVTGIPDTRIIDGSGVDITKNLTTVKNYDELHVQALINQINGKQSSGRYALATPNLYGMNMQSISVGQKVTAYCSSLDTNLHMQPINVSHVSFNSN